MHNDIFEAFSAKLHKNYDAELRHHESDKLVIIFSPNPRFAMYNINFEASTLFLTDKKLFYYLYNPARQVALLHQFIVSSNFKHVTIIGSSKGGSGALLWSSILSNINENAYKVFCLSFSPQTKLYPESKIIKYPSYLNVIKTAETSLNHEKCLKRYGDLKPFIEKSRAKTIVFFSEYYDIDKHEANYIKETDIQLVKLPLTFHGSVTPYLLDKTDPDKLKSIVKKMFRNSSKDLDLAATLPETEQELFDMLNKVNVPFIVDLVSSLSK